MRIKLKKGKQNELIIFLKKNYSWKKLSNILNISEGYLRNELKNEDRLLSEKLYLKINKLANKNFDKFIIEKLKDNWGQSKGGFKSTKNIKQIKYPKESEDLAEIIGIILGDGHVGEFKKGKKIRCYMVRIAGNAIDDKDYLTNYIPKLFEKVFNEKGSLHFSKKSKVGYFTLYGKNYIQFIKSKGIQSGNKKKNNQNIPIWIKQNKKYLSRCIKGLIDTDGSIHYISKRNLNLRINYTSYIPNLLKDVRKGLIELGFVPCKIICNKQIFISKKEEVTKYVKEIGFGNQKNLNRFKLLRKKEAPLVQGTRMHPSQIAEV